MKQSNTSSCGNQNTAKINVKHRYSCKLLPKTIEKLDNFNFNNSDSFNKNEHTHKINTIKTNFINDLNDKLKFYGKDTTNTLKVSNKLQVMNLKSSSNDKSYSHNTKSLKNQDREKNCLQTKIRNPNQSPHLSKTFQDLKKNQNKSSYIGKNNFLKLKQTGKNSLEEEIKHNSSRRISETTSNTQTLSFTNNLIDIISKIKKIIKQTKYDLDSTIEDKNIGLLSTMTSIHKEIEQLHEKNKIIEKNEEYTKEKFESTKLNLDLISISSDRRNNIYKDYIKMCIENMSDINFMIKSNKNIRNNMKESIIIEQNITNNIINNHTHSSGSNVNFNVNLNLNTINNLANKEMRDLRKMKKLISRKKVSKNKFYNHGRNNSDEIMDLSESVICEGVAEIMPYRFYMVNKPKDEKLKYKLFTEADLFISEDESSESENSYESEFLDRINNLKIENKRKKSPFIKTRSKSLLDIRNISINIPVVNPRDDKRIKKAHKQTVKVYEDNSITTVFLIFKVRVIKDI